MQASKQSVAVRISLVLAIAIFAAFVVAPHVLAGDAPQIMKVAGRAEILKMGQWRDAAIGDTLSPGDMVRTGEGGEMTLSAEDDAINITTRPDTEVRYEGKIAAAAKPWLSAELLMDEGDAPGENLTQQFSTPKGEVEADVKTGTKLRIVAPLLTAAVRGTNFVMRAHEDGSSYLTVQKGAVDAFNRAGQTEVVTEGLDFSFTTSEFNIILRERGILDAGQSWRDLPAQVVDAFTNEQLIMPTAQLESQGDSTMAAGQDAAVGQGDSAATSTDTAAASEAAESETIASGQGADASGGADAPGDSADGTDDQSLSTSTQLTALFADPDADPMAGDSFDSDASGMEAVAVFVGYEVADSLTVTNDNEDVFSSTAPDIPDNINDYLRPASVTGAHVSGILGNASYRDPGVRTITTPFSGTFGFDVNLQSGQIDNAAMTGSFSEHSLGTDYNINYNLSNGTGSMWNSGAGADFSISDFSGTRVSTLASDGTFHQSHLMDGSSKLAGNAAQGFDALGNPVTGTFELVNIDGGNLVKDVWGDASGIVTEVR